MSEQPPDQGADAVAAVQRGFELFNAGDLETLFTETFDPEIAYRGDPDISALAGFPTDAEGVSGVRAVWEGFFAMFDEVQLTEVELAPEDEHTVLGSCHMVTQGARAASRSTRRFTSPGYCEKGAGPLWPRSWTEIRCWPRCAPADQSRLGGRRARSELPGVAERLPARRLALVEAMSVAAIEARVELKMGGAGAAGPVFCRIEQARPDPL